MYRLFIVASVLAAVAASAEPRVAILGFKGPKAALVREQLKERICQDAECVKPGRKGAKVSVDGVVTGKVLRKGRRLTLELKVYTSNDPNPVTVKMPIRKTGKMSEAAIASAVASVRGAITEME